MLLPTQNAHRAAEQSRAILEDPAAVKKLSTRGKNHKNHPGRQHIAAHGSTGKPSEPRARAWAIRPLGGYKHNPTKEMAATVTAYQQYGFSSPEELDEACLCRLYRHAGKPGRAEADGKDAGRKKELQRQVLADSKTRPVRGRAETAEKRQSKISRPSEARKRLYHRRQSGPSFQGRPGISKTCRAHKSLQAEIESLIKKKNVQEQSPCKREEYCCFTVRGTSRHLYAGKETVKAYRSTWLNVP